MWPFRKQITEEQSQEISASINLFSPKADEVLRLFEKSVEIATPLLVDASALNNARIGGFDVSDSVRALAGRTSEIAETRDVIQNLSSALVAASANIGVPEERGWWPKKQRKALEDWDTCLALATSGVQTVADSLLEGEEFSIEPGQHRLNMFCNGLGFIGIALRHHEQGELIRHA